MIKIAICDDDIIYTNKIKTYISMWSQERNLPVTILTFDNGDDLLDYYKTGTFDIILLDIIMPLLNGMVTAHELRKNDSKVKIIFLTSSSDFAVESYNVKATNYLLKPIKQQRLFEALDDCLKLLDIEHENITIKIDFGYKTIYLHDIECIEAQNKKVIFYLINGSKLQCSSPFSYFLELLTYEKGFFRIHRSYIVYLPNIDTFTSDEVVTKNGVHIPVARSIKKSFKDAYFEYMFEKGFYIND